METRSEQNGVISDEDIYDAFESRRRLMQGRELRPETPEDEPGERSEWDRGNVASNLFCQATTGTPEERAVKIWRYMANLKG